MEFNEIIGKSSKMQEIFLLIEKVAKSTVSILITGENGTGKELVARKIFTLSQRGEKPFIALNCAAIPSELIESELFGHEKSAFTGASQQRVGRFEQADGGTLFLDEIGDMSLSTQTKILRVLQEQEFERIGGNKTIHVDVRVIAATNKDLARAIIDGSFREDLFYRLNVVEIQIPPLRERREDIILLCRFFVESFSKKYRKPIESISEDLESILYHYDWPGNVRELKNVIERAVVLCTGNKIEREDLPDRLASPRIKEDLTDLLEIESEGKFIPLDVMTKRYVEKVLAYSKGNKLKASRILGIDPKTLRSRLKD